MNPHDSNYMMPAEDNTESEFILIKELLPKKGEDIIGIDENEDIYYCFRCNCDNQKCKKWYCSSTGNELIIDIVKWKNKLKKRLIT